MLSIDQNVYSTIHRHRKTMRKATVEITPFHVYSIINIVHTNVASVVLRNPNLKPVMTRSTVCGTDSPLNFRLIPIENARAKVTAAV